MGAAFNTEALDQSICREAIAKLATAVSALRKEWFNRVSPNQQIRFTNTLNRLSEQAIALYEANNPEGMLDLLDNIKSFQPILTPVEQLEFDKKYQTLRVMLKMRHSSYGKYGNTDLDWHTKFYADMQVFLDRASAAFSIGDKVRLDVVTKEYIEYKCPPRIK